jgi:hypothetical protein
VADAAISPLITLKLWEAAGGEPWLVGLYLSSMGVLTFIALILTPETKEGASASRGGLGVNSGRTPSA